MFILLHRSKSSCCSYNNHLHSAMPIVSLAGQTLHIPPRGEVKSGNMPIPFWFEIIVSHKRNAYLL